MAGRTLGCEPVSGRLMLASLLNRENTGNSFVKTGKLIHVSGGRSSGLSETDGAFMWQEVKDGADALPVSSH